MIFQKQVVYDCSVCGAAGLSHADALVHPHISDLVARVAASPGTQTGIKHDAAKPPLDLLDPLALEGLAAVLEFGRKKYAAHNWRGGFAWMRLMAALLRHAFAIIKGEDNDPESGLPHIDHLGCCWMFLSNMMKTRKDLDDRYRATVSSSDAATGSSTSAS